MQPLLVIARGEIRCWVHLLDIVAGATGNRDWRGDLHGEDTPFPVVVKHGFVLLPHDGTEPVHPSHVVNTVHATSPVCSSPVPSPGGEGLHVLFLVTESPGRFSLL